MYKSDVFPENEFIYIPDTLKPNDKIKVTVKPVKWQSIKAKSKEYKFKYYESEKIIVKIIYKKRIHLIRMRRCRLKVPAEFW